jgi:signal transduction histidine kinase
MKRIGLLVVLVAALLLMGVGALVARALESIEQEEAMRHGVVASRVFDEVERELTALIEREEERSFLEYTYLYVPESQLPGTTGLSLSPLAHEPAEGYVLGHFQIDPDGALQLPWQPRLAEEQLLDANDWQVPEPDDRTEEETALRELVAELQEPMRLEWGRRVPEQDTEAEDATAFFETTVERAPAPAPKSHKVKKQREPVIDAQVAPEPAPVEAAPVQEAVLDLPAPASAQQSPPDAPAEAKAEEVSQPASDMHEEREREVEVEQLRRSEERQETAKVAVTSPRSGARKKDRAPQKAPASEMDYLESLNKGGRSRAGRRSRSAPYSQGNTDVFRGDRGLELEEDEDAVAAEVWTDEEAEDADQELTDESRASLDDGLVQTDDPVQTTLALGADVQAVDGQPVAGGSPVDGYGAVQGEVAFEPLAGRSDNSGSEAAPLASADTVRSIEVAGAEVDLGSSQRDGVTGPLTDEDDARQSPNPPASAPDPEPTPEVEVDRDPELQQLRTAEEEPRTQAVAAPPPAPTRGRASSTRHRRPEPQSKELDEPATPEPPVEVTVEPLIGLRLDADHLVLRRDVRVGDDHYIQGLVLRLPELSRDVHSEVVGGGELEPFVTLSWDGVSDPASSWDEGAGYRFDHAFEAPFAQLGASLTLDRLPTDTGDDPRSWVLWLALLLAVVVLLGLGALYRAVAVVVHFAERRNNFVAAVSHELKTPLTAIRMYGEILREGMVAGEERKQEYYETITTESERLSRLINNVLELSRLEKGTRSMALEAGNVAPIVENVTQLLSAHAAERGFELRVEIDDDLPSVRFDRDALLQVLINLTDNAIKFAHGSDDKVVVIHCSREGEGVTLKVRDHGPGVPAGQLRRIFQPFFRGERELTRNTKGTGIGLALVQGLIDQMGGRVTARNHPQGGFEVSIALA